MRKLLCQREKETTQVPPYLSDLLQDKEYNLEYINLRGSVCMRGSLSCSGVLLSIKVEKWVPKMGAFSCW